MAAALPGADVGATLRNLAGSGAERLVELMELRVAVEVQAAGLAARGEAITPESLDRAMALSHVRDPDLLIRTGGEMRLSNFLLWQAAYSELVFSDKLWPDFDEAALDSAIAAYHARERRFGLISEQLASESPVLARA